MIARKSIPIGVLFMILVIALALLGVGYAMWSETLTIQGNVSTGEVDVEFSQYPAEECIDIQGVLTCPEPAEKAAAANCTVAWSNTATDPNDNGANKLLVTITGMYPSYHCKVAFDVTSTGNVPVHVWQPKVVGTIPAWVATDFANCYPEGKQLHQGQSTGKCTMDIHFTNDQAPLENSGPITFGWTILATQFNENPTETIEVVSSQLNFGPTGWGGWSCPATHPKIVSATLEAVPPTGTATVSQSLAWKPGASVAGYSYPTTPFGYTYASGEQGWIVQNDNDQDPMKLHLTCSN